MASNVEGVGRRLTIFDNVFFTNEAFAMKKKDVPTSQESSRGKFGSPVVDPLRFVEGRHGRMARHPYQKYSLLL